MSFIDFVENWLNQDNLDSVTNAAVNSFLNSAKINGLDEVTEEALNIWIVEMIIAGTKQTSRKRYVAKLHSLYLEFTNNSEFDDPFLNVKEAIEYNMSTGVVEAHENLEKVKFLINHMNSDFGRTYISLALYLLYNVNKSLSSTLNLRFEDVEKEKYTSQVYDLIEGMKSDPRRKFVFQVGQGRKREPQLLRETTAELSALLQMAGMKFESQFSRESITSIWISAALKSGIRIRNIRGMLDIVPAGFEFLKFIEDPDLTNKQRDDILNIVSNTINNNTTQWFVMKLRNRVTPDDISKSIAVRCADYAPNISYYYPTRQSIRVVGKRKIKEELPILPGLLFFRMNRSGVGKLMSKIGDLAWCFKTSSRKASEYASISRTEMREFQRHIGMFSPDIEIEICENVEQFTPGEKVEIVGGGIMEGHQGVVEKLVEMDGEQKYQLKISDNLQLKWTITLPSPLLRKA